MQDSGVFQSCMPYPRPRPEGLFQGLVQPLEANLSSVEIASSLGPWSFGPCGLQWGSMSALLRGLGHSWEETASGSVACCVSPAEGPAPAPPRLPAWAAPLRL